MKNYRKKSNTHAVGKKKTSDSKFGADKAPKNKMSAYKKDKYRKWMEEEDFVDELPYEEKYSDLEADKEADFLDEPEEGDY